MVVTLRGGEGGGKSSCSSNLMPPGLVSSATDDTREGVEYNNNTIIFEYKYLAEAHHYAGSLTNKPLPSC